LVIYASTSLADTVLDTAVTAVRSRPETLIEILEQLPAPVYVTDARGVVTHFNRACIEFAGRNPAAGQDRWCVTWRLYTVFGEPVPHSECPMAVAITTKRPLRGVMAIAERPDGTRVSFLPFPTPVVGPGGELRAAVNMLIDVTELRQVAALRDQAARAERLACDCSDVATAETLRTMAVDCEAEASRLEQEISCPFIKVA
jgi:PAS domain-containing protein